MLISDWSSDGCASDLFWLQHDPEGPHGQDRILPGAPDDKLFSIFRSLPELAIHPPMSVRYACSGAFSSIRYRGKVFVINPSCQLDESVSLTGIIDDRLRSEEHTSELPYLMRHT